MPERSAEQRAFEAALRQNLRERAALMTGLQSDSVQQLRVLAGEIAALLAAQPADWQVWQLTALQGQVQALIDGLQGTLASAVDTGLQAAWAAGVQGVEAPLAAAGIHVQVYLPALDSTVLTAIRSYTQGRIKDLTAKAGATVDQAIHLAVLGAQTPGQAIKAVQATLGTKEAASAQRAKRIVITSMGEAYAVANQQRLGQAAVHVPGVQKQWRRSGKIHSRWNHDAMDGVTVDADQPFQVPTKGASAFVAMMHPHDPKAPPAEIINCGCVARPWLSRWGLAPGGTPFSEREVALNPMKAATQAWLAGRRRA